MKKILFLALFLLNQKILTMNPNARICPVGYVRDVCNPNDLSGNCCYKCPSGSTFRNSTPFYGLECVSAPEKIFGKGN